MACKTLKDVVTTIKPRPEHYFEDTGHNVKILETMYEYFSPIGWAGPRGVVCSTQLVLDFLTFEIKWRNMVIELLKRENLIDDLDKYLNHKEACLCYKTMSEEAKDLIYHELGEGDDTYNETVFDWDSDIANATVDQLKDMDLPEIIKDEFINIIENEINVHFRWELVMRIAYNKKEE